MPLRNNLLSYNHESVETNIGSWFSNNGNTTLTRDTAQAFEGVASQKLVAVAAGNVSSGLTGVLVQPGRTFTISCWVFTTTASLTSRIDVDWYTGTGTGSFISTTSTANVSIPTSTWTQVSVIATSPATAGEARIFVGNATATGAGQTMFVDSVFLGLVGDVIQPSQPGPAPNPAVLWRQAPPLGTFDAAAPSVTEISGTRYVTANATTVTTDSFTPADNCLLVAQCGMGNGLGSASSLGAVTDSLGGTWTRLAGEASASGGVAEIWARDIGTGAAMTVTYDPGGTGASGLDIICRWYAGAKAVASQPGATVVNAGGTGYQTSITTAAVGSVVVGSLGRASDAQTVVPNPDTTLYGQVNGASGDTAALFRARSVTPAAGPIVLGFVNTPAGVNRIALVEILPSAGAPVTNAPAESTLGVGFADDASTDIDVNTESTLGTGTAADATPAVGANAEATLAAGSAANATVAVTASAEATLGAGTADNAAPSVGVNADSTLGAGTAYDATVSIVPATEAPAESTLGVGAAADATPAVGSNAESTLGAGTAADGTAAVVTDAESALGVGAADNAAPSVAVNAQATLGAGMADAASVGVGANAEATLGTAVAADGSAAITVNAESTVGAATAYDATVSTATQTSAPAESTLGAGTAYDATVAVAVQADAATGTAVAADASVAVAITAQDALAAAAAFDAMVLAVPATYAYAESAAATGAAFDATVVTFSTGVVTRPDIGVVTRPSAGTVTRPTAGTIVRPNTGTVVRPDSGVVTRP